VYARHTGDDTCIYYCAAEKKKEEEEEAVHQQKYEGNIFMRILQILIINQKRLV
jgi:hypothetical protein